MNTKEFLKNVCSKIKYKPAIIPITEELKSHIEEIKQDKISIGFSEKEAEEMAVNEMGNSAEIGNELNKIHRPKLEWKILVIAISLILIRFFLYFNQYLEYYSVSIISKDIFYIIIGILISIVIYFINYKKIQKFSNTIFIIATGIIIFQWINWYFGIDRNISKLINSIFRRDIYEPSILNIRLWYISMFLYIISFSGALIENKKINLSIMCLLSVLLIYFQSGSISNSIVLITSYLLMVIVKKLQNENIKLKNLIISSFIVLFISFSILILLGNFNSFLAERTYNNDFLEYNEQKVNILNNLKLFGETENTFFKNTNSLFLQILAKIGIIPSSVLIIFITLMSIILIKDSLKIHDLYGTFLITGLSTFYIVQFILHILMNLNILPTSDINMPFISEGNLFFLVNVIGLAIIMSVYRIKDIYYYEKHSKIELSNT